MQRRPADDHRTRRPDVDRTLQGRTDRLGFFQLVFLDRIPAHAAVGESVELAKRDAPRGAGLVNAVLRRAGREGRGIVAKLPDATPKQAALKHSHPEWIAQLWWTTFGPETAKALMAADNEPAEPSLRANTLKTTARELAGRIPAHVVDDEALLLDGPFDAFESPEWRAGELMPQSRAAMAVSRALAPAPGERVLDLCAAPGGKTTHLAALMGNRGEVVAVEKHPGRADALRKTAARMGATIVDVRTQDARQPVEPGETFDRVLVDPPCSGLGTLQSRPDLRWHATPDAPTELQARILDTAARNAERRIVYSTCTISRAENEDQVAAFLDRHPEYTLSGTHVTLPHRDRTDGFFIATLDRG